MSLKKYIIEEIAALEENISLVDNFFLNNKYSPLQEVALLETKKILLFTKEVFKDEKSDTVYVENIYNKLPLLYQRLNVVIGKK